MLFINSLNDYRKANFGTLVATEEFPYEVVLTPSPPTPAVIKSVQLAGGIHTISREYNSSVRMYLSLLNLHYRYAYLCLHGRSYLLNLL